MSRRLLIAIGALVILFVLVVNASADLGGPGYRWYPKPWIQGPSNYATANPNGTDLCKDANGVVGGCDDAACAAQQAINDRMTPPGPLVCDIDSQPRIEKYQSAPGCPLNTILDAGADEYYTVGCEPYGYGVVPASSSGTLVLTLISQTATTITLGWTPVPNAVGYRFSRSDQTKRPHTWDGTRSQVTFGKGALTYSVEALIVSAAGTYTP